MTADFYLTQILPHAGIIVKICRAYTDNQQDFEDYYQEVCLQIWRSHKNYSGDSKWSTWLYRLTLNVCLTYLKKKKNDPHHFTSDALAEEVDTQAEQQFFKDDSINKLYSAIKQLSEIDRAVILLYLEENSYQDIADIIGTKPNNIGVRIKRIKTRLAKIMKLEEQ